MRSEVSMDSIVKAMIKQTVMCGPILLKYSDALVTGGKLLQWRKQRFTLQIEQDVLGRTRDTTLMTAHPSNVFLEVPLPFVCIVVQKFLFEFRRRITFLTR